MVSNPNFGPQVYSTHDVDTSAPTCSSWPRGQRIYSRDTFGAIDGGSSGSPIVNGSTQIVGQLSGTCGTNPSDPCSSGEGEANATVNGAFAFYYPSVQPILDP
jgi:lysyl endopeptidase